MSLGPLYVLLGEVSVQVFCPFFNWIVCLPGVESCEFIINILEIKPLSKVSLTNMFYHIVHSLFFLMLFSLAMQQLFILMRSHLFILSFMSFSLGTYQWKHCCVEYLRFSCQCFPLGLLWCLNLNTFSFKEIVMDAVYSRLLLEKMSTACIKSLTKNLY